MASQGVELLGFQPAVLLPPTRSRCPRGSPRPDPSGRRTSGRGSHPAPGSTRPASTSHTVGVCGGRSHGQESRISQSGTSTVVSNMCTTLSDPTDKMQGIHRPIPQSRQEFFSRTEPRLEREQTMRKAPITDRRCCVFKAPYERSRRRSSPADGTARAPAARTPSATSRSLDTTTTGRPAGSARTTRRMTVSAVVPAGLNRTRTPRRRGVRRGHVDGGPVEHDRHLGAGLRRERAQPGESGGAAAGPAAGRRTRSW